MIIITGASGKLGSLVVARLLERVSPEEIGISVRDPEKVIPHVPVGVRVRRGDFSDEASLASSFEGASRVLVVSSNARATGGNTVKQHQSAINAAKRAGVRRIVYTSHMAAGFRSEFPPMRDHAATEEILSRSGVPWTALRNGFYAASALPMFMDGLESGVIELPRDGKVSWTTHEDLAEAAASVLASEAPVDGPTAALVSPDAMDMEDVAKIASGIRGRVIERRVLSDGEFVEKACGRGLPAGLVDIMIGFYRAARDGEFAAVSPALGELIGHAPQSFGDFLTEKLTISGS